MPIQRQGNTRDAVLRPPLGLLSEDYNRVKEETEKRSFPNPEELSLSSLLHICVRISLHVSHELPEGRSSVFNL